MGSEMCIRDSVIRTEYGHDLIVDDEYLWNMDDAVGLVMPEDKMKFQLKK